MKKMVLAVLGLFLIIPVLSDAGSLSSRYDVTFGGFVKYDLGWSSQNMPGDPPGAYRSSTSTRAVFGDEFSNTFQSAGETRFNFLVKGPDLWGARTSAFIEGDFRGVDTGNQYGGFQLRHAFMTLKWSSAELMIGQNWQQWGMPYYGAWIGANDFAMYNRGVRQPQAAFRYFFTKELNAMAGIIAATDAYGATRQYNDGYARSNWPGLMGEIAYWTDRCGKIGPNNLKFALGGYFGKDKVVDVDLANTSTFKDDTIDAWQAVFRYSLPLVPERKGSKQMAVLLTGNFFIGQDSGGAGSLLSSDFGSGTYLFIDYGAADWRAASPTYFGLFSQASWWLTNDVQLNAMYGYLKRNFSEGARGGLRNFVNMQQSYAANILWDTNQAVRLGLQWMRIFTSYNGANPGTGTGPGMAERTGTIDQYRLAVWYFF